MIDKHKIIIIKLELYSNNINCVINIIPLILISQIKVLIINHFSIFTISIHVV